MMKKKIIITGIATLMIITGLSGCSTKNNNENQLNQTLTPELMRFIGLWKTNPENINWTFNFFSNGTFQRMEGVVGGNYTINDGKLVLTYLDEIWMGDTFDYIFSDGNNTLTLIQTSPNENVLLFKE
jgi:hypothetical protein